MFTPNMAKGNKRQFENFQSSNKPSGPTMFSMGSPTENLNKSTDKRGQLQHRTSLRRLCSVNDKLSKEQREVVQSMGFSCMLNLKVVEIDMTVMNWLINNFDPSTCILNMNGTKINIDVDMVKVTLGIPSSGKKISTHTRSTIGRDRYNILFMKNDSNGLINLRELEAKIEDSGFGQWFKIYYMMLLCATLFLPKYNSLDLEILDYLVDLDNIKTYNWAELVLRGLVDGVNKYKRGNSTVTGCIYLLQVIFVTELCRMLPTFSKFIASSVPYAEQWDQDEVSAILLEFKKSGGIEGSIGTGGTKDIGSKKTEDRNNEQPFQSSYCPKSNSDDHTLLQSTADHIQLLSTQMVKVEDNILRLLSNTSGTYAPLSRALLDFMVKQAETLCARMSNVKSSIEKFRIEKNRETQCNFENFSHWKFTKTEEEKPISPKQSPAQGKEKHEKTPFKEESNTPVPNKMNEKQKFENVSDEANLATSHPKMKQEPEIMEEQTNTHFSNMMNKRQKCGDVPKKTKLATPHQKVKQEPGFMEVQTEKMRPRTLNFESVDTKNKYSSTKKSVEDIFETVCKYMPQTSHQTRIINNLLSGDFDKSEIMAMYGNITLYRSDLQTLNPGRWLLEDIINGVVEITWYERKSCPIASQDWNLPTRFATWAGLDYWDDNQIDKRVFGDKGRYRSSPSQCRTICIPIILNGHFFLCKLDIDKKVIEICDTLRSGADGERLIMIKKVVQRLESISKLWGDESFTNSNWHETFECQYSTTVPRQPNSYDCGIYVCLLMMFPQGVNRALTEVESISTRRRLALKLYTFRENTVFDRLNCDSVIANNNEALETSCVEDIFTSICNYMPHPANEFNIIDNLMSLTLDSNELLVSYHLTRLYRSHLQTLNSERCLHPEILDCVVDLTWQERQPSASASGDWNLPTSFAEMALDTANSDEHINDTIFHQGERYRSSTSECSTICIPIHRQSHFFLCKIDLMDRVIEICDRFLNEEVEVERLAMVQNVVIRLERVSKLWEDESFRHSNWHETFDYRQSYTYPIQPNSYDCGIYVCLMLMFPLGVNRVLTKEEMVSTRRRLALKFYTFKGNKIYDRNSITILGSNSSKIGFDFEVVGQNVNTDGMTLTGISQMFVEHFKIPHDPKRDYLSLSKVPENLSTATHLQCYSIFDDEELKKYVQRCLDIGIREIRFLMGWLSSEKEHKNDEEGRAAFRELAQTVDDIKKCLVDDSD